MKHRTYQAFVYISIGISLVGLVGMILTIYFNGDFSFWSSFFLALMLIGIVALIVVQCLYRALKAPSKTLDQTKECPHCHCVNDKDAEYCKECGKRFRNF